MFVCCRNPQDDIQQQVLCIHCGGCGIDHVPPGTQVGSGGCANAVRPQLCKGSNAGCSSRYTQVPAWGVQVFSIHPVHVHILEYLALGCCSRLGRWLLLTFPGLFSYGLVSVDGPTYEQVCTACLMAWPLQEGHRTGLCCLVMDAAHPGSS
jgi:hypothetical protein